MKAKLLPILITITLLSLPAGGCSSIFGPAGDNNDQEPIQASGVIEADQINIAPEVPGRIKEIHVAEGDTVTAGDLIFSLEDDLFQAQKAQAAAQYDAALASQESAITALESAQAMHSSAKANHNAIEVQYQQALAQAQIMAGNSRVSDWVVDPPGQIELPAWYFQQPEMITAAKNIADLAWEDYQDELDNYQEIAVEIGGEEFQRAENDLADAQAAFQVAETLQNRQVNYWNREDIIDRIDSLHQEAETALAVAHTAFNQILTDPQYEEILAARARVSVAREHYDIAKDYLAGLYTGEYAFEVQAAEALVAQAEAGLRQAEAQVKQAENGLVSAEAAIKQALAALEIINLQVDKTQIHSPISGVVLSQTFNAGEMISAGLTALTIGDLNNLTVTVYLPEDRYGQVDLGDTAEVSIDSFPDQTFDAEVVYISDEAEYTPRNVQTQEERQNTVYAVRLRVMNPAGTLKPGMPADVVFYP